LFGKQAELWLNNEAYIYLDIWFWNTI
jgi:hypothetical protein